MVQVTDWMPLAADIPAADGPAEFRRLLQMPVRMWQEARAPQLQMRTKRCTVCYSVQHTNSAVCYASRDSGLFVMPCGGELVDFEER